MDWKVCRLEDDDLVVRPFTDRDRDALGVSLRDAKIGRYFGRALGEPPPPDPDAPDFAIVEGGAVVGRVWFRPGVRPYEIGYFLRSDAWGRGLATRSVRIVCDWLLEDRGEEQVDLRTHPGNLRSQAVAERTGFRPDGIDEAYAEFKDGTRSALRFARTRDERLERVDGGEDDAAPEPAAPQRHAPAARSRNADVARVGAA